MKLSTASLVGLLFVGGCVNVHARGGGARIGPEKDDDPPTTPPAHTSTAATSPPSSPSTASAPDFSSDPQNCGSVGVSCGAGGTCQSGHCTACVIPLNPGVLVPQNEATQAFECRNMPRGARVKAELKGWGMTIPNVNNVVVGYELLNGATKVKLDEFNSGWQHKSAHDSNLGGWLTPDDAGTASVRFLGHCAIDRTPPPVACRVSGDLHFRVQ